MINLLIVDDVPENLSVLHDTLDESGYRVLVATNGESALARARQARPAAILLDAVMPGMDGFEVCRHLREDPHTHDIPVIFMTGLADLEHVIAAFAAGAADYVTKPLRPPEVLARISSHLARTRLLDQARTALDSFDRATLAIDPLTGVVIWQTPLARALLEERQARPVSEAGRSSPDVHDLLKHWLEEARIRHAGGQAIPALTVHTASGRLMFTHRGETPQGEWLVALRRESDQAEFHALMRRFGLTNREAEVLGWVMRGKTNRDIAEILSMSPRTADKHLQHVLEKLGVETRTAATALALSVVESRPAPGQA